MACIVQLVCYQGTTVIGHLRNDALYSTRLQQILDYGSNHDSKREVLDVMLSFVMDLADNFDAFPTSKVKPSFSKMPLAWVLVRSWLLPRPGFIAGARCITSLRCRSYPATPCIHQGGLDLTTTTTTRFVIFGANCSRHLVLT